MSEKPAEMRRFFKEASAYTNSADLVEQNERAMGLFRRRIDSTTNGTKKFVPSHSAS